MTVQEPYQRYQPSGLLALQYESFSRDPRLEIFPTLVEVAFFDVYVKIQFC